ncbi:MAG: protein kinase [Zavarzinella sp.]
MSTKPKAPMLQELGEYDIISKIAEGGMGAVYKGKHRTTQEIVAIKVLPSVTAQNPVLVKRFEQEFRTAKALNHPNVVRAIAYCGNPPTPYLVMEFVDGVSLGAMVDRDGPMKEKDALRIIAQVCQGLHRAHKQKLIHRDVKPDNVLVNREGLAKLTDMGLVKDIDNEVNLTKTGRGLGTPNYMAPEQFRNAKNVDVRCDVYSAAATLYTMVTGEIPFGKVSPLDCWMKKIRNELTAPRDLNPALSERVDWAIRRAMSADPDKRPASCKEFIEDLTGTSIRPQSKGGTQESQNDIFYLSYQDETGEAHTVKGSPDGIRRAIQEGILGDIRLIRAGRSKSGPFAGLESYAEFRDLVIEPAPMNIPGMKPIGSAHSAPPPAQTASPTYDYAPTTAHPVSAYDEPTTAYQPQSTQKPFFNLTPKQTSEQEISTQSSWWVWVLIVGLGILIAVGTVVLLPMLKG